MNRNVEKCLVYCGAIWNIITASFTILGYSSWFKKSGISVLENKHQLTYINSTMVDSITKVIMIFGLFMLTIGIINLFVAKNFTVNQIDKRVIVWLWAVTGIQFMSFDLIGLVFYLVATVLYCSKNKAIRMILQEKSYSN
ncbi:hypothetical protein UAY_01198 [Enterococcus moraviensis ATCC BAA-383]|uniref:Uncharacterized protein n=1 Tax=Enterococcus moraviensis ATCC BAA-383 TaxID=1158609 RepID=R2QYZ5_9ENTE|nr:hypothetical protein [Enterococcus moraviensis]EOI01790.1 hypothetical protein UAY_01198 [Enterococcus moraviensis ATCC BAA-383]EOT73675.1 hypothetical protein I586_00669 [Enterococcus moraviensis ATCC BAA-383]